MSLKSITFIIPDFSVGGVEKAFIGYANALVNRYNVSFIVLRRTGELTNYLNPNIVVHELGVKRIRYAFPKILSVLSHNKFDCVITGTEVTNIYAVLANKILGNKFTTITSQHNFLGNECSTKIFSHILPWAHKNATGVYAVSNAIRNLLVKELGVNEDKVSVIYNPLNIEEINRLSKEHCEPIKSKYILFVGRLYPVKNVEYLIRAYKLINDANQNIKLVIIGDGVQKDNLTELTKELNLTNNIIFTGSLSNPYPYINDAEIVVVPSLSESFSIVIAESLALGKTVVSTPCEGPMEIIGHEYGYISNSFTDPKILGDSILYAIDNKIDCNKLISYSKKFSIEPLIEELIHLIEQQ
jgi:glycosyltransferase involved in cell wall biosynthesis